MTNQDNHQNNVVQDYGLKPAIDMYELKPGDYITLTGLDYWMYRGLSEKPGQIIIEHFWSRKNALSSLNEILFQLHASDAGSTRYVKNCFSIDDLPGVYAPVSMEDREITFGCFFSDYFFTGIFVGKPPTDQFTMFDHLAPLDDLKSSVIGLELMDSKGEHFQITDLHREELSFHLPAIHFLPFTAATLTPLNGIDEPHQADLRQVAIEYRTVDWVKAAKENRGLRSYIERTRNYTLLENSPQNEEHTANIARSYVYRMWDKNGVLLYIGKSNNPLNRWKQHRKKPWFKQVTRFEYEPHPDEAAAYAAEREAIKTEHPLYNIVNNGVK